eukprot:1144038-Pelagomonas_calceolata.AAC.1
MWGVFTAYVVFVSFVYLVLLLFAIRAPPPDVFVALAALLVFLVSPWSLFVYPQPVLVTNTELDMLLSWCRSQS